MPDRILDLRLFRYALASAEYGSIRRAAEALNVQHSTVSKGIRNLEHRIGAELFERHHSGVRITPAGDRFIKEANLGFDHLRRAMQRAGALHRGEEGHLSVVVSVPLILLGQFFETFQTQYEGVFVEVMESTTSAGLALVEQRKADVAFVVKTSDSASRQCLVLWDEQMIVVLPKSHALARADRLTLADLSRERVVLTAGGLGPDIQDHLGRQMAASGAQPKVHLHRVSQCNLITMVARGFGVTIVVGPLSRAAPEDVVLVPLEGRNVFSICAVWIGSNPNPLVKSLLDMVERSERRGMSV